ncbi:MAG TPA: terminase [Gammaproteobacteria bacterium]
MTALLAVPAAGEVLGHTVPRVFTPPLVTGPPGPCGCGCALTPETSDGFDAVDFATNVLGVPPDPWQRWLLIHGLELLPDGRPRFRRVVVLVARQNGKTYLLSILACFWMYVCGPLNLLGSSTKTAMAVKAWQKAIQMARAVPDLAAEIPRKRGVLSGGGIIQWNLLNGSRYEPVASNEEGGRGDSLDRVIADELRQHRDYSAYGASYHAMRNRPYGQFWALSSMGDDRSVVLNDLRDQGLAFIETGDGNERLGLFEWSPPEGADPTDPQTIAAANPNVNRFRPDGTGTPMDDLLGEARAAVVKGGAALTDFLTEALNIRVKSLNPAIDIDAWRDSAVPGPIGFDDLRGRVAFCLDVAMSGQHATLYAAARQADGRVRIRLVQRWEGFGCGDQAVRELPEIAAEAKPRKLGYLPVGPAAAIVSTLGASLPGQWPRGVEVEQIRGDLPAVSMGLAEAVVAGQIIRDDIDERLNEQVETAEKLKQGDAWRFNRKLGDAETLYAVAGAVHLARGLAAAPVPTFLRPRRPDAS